MKFLRLIFSRITVILLAVLLQFALVIGFTFYFSHFKVVFAIVSNVLMILTLLLIVNRDMDSEAKLPWSILTALVPIVGFVTYLTLSHNYASRKERKMFAKLPQLKLADLNPSVPTKYQGQVNYLQNIGAPSFSDTATAYFGCGEDFFADLLCELEKAEKFVFMEYFIVEHGKMLDSILEVLQRKASNGVEVRLLYDDMGSLPHVKGNFHKTVRKMGISCVRFAPLRPVISAVYNNRDHRKITVIDGKVGYMSGINISDEYINEKVRFGYWKDSAVKLCGNAVSSLTTMFLQMYGMATQKYEDFDKFLVSVPTTIHDKGIVIPFGDGPRPLYKEQLGKTVYLNLINQAAHSLYITTPYLIVDDGFMLSLCNAAKRGVDVNIIIPAIPDKKSVYAMTKQSCRKLVEAGVKIYKFSAGFMHAKSVVADGVSGVVGTINLDYRSFVHHYECGVFMYDTAAVHELYDDLISTAEKSELQLTAPKLNIAEKLVCILGAVFRPLL